VAASALIAPAVASAGIKPVVEDGRVIYVNDDSADKPQPKPQAPAPAQRRFIYWSVTERKWKPVPVPSAGALRAARSAAAEVSDYVEAQPRVSNAPPSTTGGKKSKPSAYANLTSGRLVTSAEVEKAIKDAAQRHEVDPNLVRAIIQIESGFNTHAVSRKGALGLMQLMPSTARKLKVNNPFDPAQNVDAGVRHLRGLLDNYKGDIPLTLAAYNAGEGAVARNGNNIPPFAETREYVRRITNLYGNSQKAWSNYSAPLRIGRDQRGVLTITNTE
jgi:soluble lytic murein transglycosylase-like protein